MYKLNNDCTCKILHIIFHLITYCLKLPNVQSSSINKKRSYIIDFKRSFDRKDRMETSKEIIVPVCILKKTFGIITQYE